MSKVSGAIGAAMLCLGLLFSASSIMAMQDPAMPPAKEKKEQKAEIVTISGTVSTITSSAITIVDSTKAEHTVAITGETKITKAGKDAAVGDVKANDMVTVEARKEAGNTWTALKIALS
jgi:hypothetical protein